LFTDASLTRNREQKRKEKSFLPFRNEDESRGSSILILFNQIEEN